MLDSLTIVAQVIGFLVLAWIAVAVFCLMILTVLFAASLWRHWGKARYGRHVINLDKLLAVPDQEEVDNYFEKKDAAQAKKEKFDEEALEALRVKLASPPEPVEQWEHYDGPRTFNDQTEIYPPFSKEEVLDARGAHKA